MRLIKEVGKARILNPLKGFELEEQELERRFDPLTGFSTIVAKGRFQYVKRFFEHDEQLLRKLAEASQPTCPFCPGKVEETTPKFPPEMVVEGRIKVGRCYAFPSLHAHSDLNAVVVLGPKHYLSLKEMNGNLLYEGFKAGLEVLRSVHSANPSLSFASLIMNYLPTAGSSIIHPHMQVLASSLPFNYLRLLLAKSFEHYLNTASNYWKKLIEYEEMMGERFIGMHGNVAWLAPFAPSRHFEVWGIVQDNSDLLSLSDMDLRRIAEGLAKVLSFYHNKGLFSFNFALYASPLGRPLEYFNVIIRVCARLGLKEPFLNDFWAMPALLMENEIVELPEEYALAIKQCFKE